MYSDQKVVVCQKEAGWPKGCSQAGLSMYIETHTVCLSLHTHSSKQIFQWAELCR